MSAPPKNVLFLCTGNTARSILAEAILTARSGARFNVFSAGSHPKGRVNPQVLELLRAKGHSVEGLRSKSWDEFAKPDAPRMDLVVTVCDAAAAEVCPVWPGSPRMMHWSIADPGAGKNEAEVRALAEDAYRVLEGRIQRLLETETA